MSIIANYSSGGRHTGKITKPGLEHTIESASVKVYASTAAKVSAAAKALLSELSETFV